MKLSAILSSLDHGPNAIIDSKSDGNYNHDDAITSFVVQAAIDGYKVIRILSIGIFVLVYWMFKAKIKTVIQMKNLVQSLAKSLSNFWAYIFDRLMRYLFLL